MFFQRYVKPYDLLTAAFFTLALVFLAQRNWSVYLMVFVLSTVNRETTILLLPIFLVAFWRRLNLQLYGLLAAVQAVTFVTVQAVLRYHFREAPGSSVWISPMENITAHLHNPLATLFALTVIGLLFWLVFRQWPSKPVLLRTAFVIMAPALALLYIVAGQAFEYRVFAEVYPVTALLAMQGVRVG